MKPLRYNEIAKEQEWHNLDSTRTENGMILDEINNTLPPELLKEWHNG